MPLFVACDRGPGPRLAKAPKSGRLWPLLAHAKMKSLGPSPASLRNRWRRKGVYAVDCDRRQAAFRCIAATPHSRRRVFAGTLLAQTSPQRIRCVIRWHRARFPLMRCGGDAFVLAGGCGGSKLGIQRVEIGSKRRNDTASPVFNRSWGRMNGSVSEISARCQLGRSSRSSS